MLIFTRRPEQTILIGDEVKLKVLKIDGKQVKLGIKAPKSLKISRKEFIEKKSNE